MLDAQYFTTVENSNVLNIRIYLIERIKIVNKRSILHTFCII